jgi:predicted aspartyl protease
MRDRSCRSCGARRGANRGAGSPVRPRRGPFASRTLALVAGLLPAAAGLVPSPAAGLPQATPATPGARPAERSGCPVLLLSRSESGIRLVLDQLAEGSTESFPLGDRSGILGVVMPTPGAAVRQTFDVRPRAGSAATAHCSAGRLGLSYRDGHGRRRHTPWVPATELRQSQLRVVTLAEGRRESYLVREGRLVAPDPVDAPLAAGDEEPGAPAGRITVTTAAWRRPVGTVSGSIPLHRVGPYLVGWVVVPGGGTGEAILDLGATRTTLSASILSMATGARMTPAALRLPDFRRNRGPRALGGQLARADAVRLAGLRVGEIGFRNATVNVLDELPTLERHAFEAVVGTDLLGRADVVRIRAPRQGRAGELALLTESQARRTRGRACADVPFQEVAGLVVIPVTVSGVVAPFVLDTGSPMTLITPSLASSLGMFPVAGEPTTLSGLDGSSIRAWPDTLDGVEVGDARFGPVPASVAALPVLGRVGLPERAGLLGQPFLSELNALEVDWRAGLVRLCR